MSTFAFRPAKRENVGLLIGFAGGTGSGKTRSALRVATGLSGGQPFCVIDTESGRAKHYADDFRFDHGDLRAPFSPDAYTEAIEAAVTASYSVIVVDSASHEHAGEGGLLDMHEAELDRMAGQDWKKREAVKMSAWIKPKSAHKKMVQRLLGLPSHVHLILCFRAEPKVDMVRGQDGKMQIVPKQSLVGLDGWIPICEKSLPYELTASFLLTADHPGVPKPIKLQEQHRKFFPGDEQVSERAGEGLAEWARGGAVAATPAVPIKGAPVLTTAQKVAAARDVLRLPDEQFGKIVAAKLRGPLEGAPDEVIESDLIPYLRRLARKERAALDDLAEILAAEAAS